MDHIHHLSVEKITKMLDRGLDPNYHDLESGGQHSRASSVEQYLGFVPPGLLTELMSVTLSVAFITPG